MAENDRGKGTSYLKIWASIAWLFVCLIVGAVFYAEGVKTERYLRQPYEYALSAKDEAKNDCTGIEPVSLFDCVYDKGNLARENARAEQALDAQQDMAFFALLMFFASILATTVTAVGVVFVKRTLDATLLAVAETQAATSILKNDFEMRFRPWLIPSMTGDYYSFVNTNPLTKQKTFSVHPEISVTNKSDIPATIISCSVYLSMYDKFAYANDKQEAITRDQVYFLNQTPTQIFDGRTVRPLFMYSLSGDNSVHENGEAIAICQIRYSDPLGTVREMGFAFYTFFASVSCDYKRWGGPEFNYDRKIDG